MVEVWQQKIDDGDGTGKDSCIRSGEVCEDTSATGACSSVGDEVENKCGCVGIVGIVNILW